MGWVLLLKNAEAENLFRISSAEGCHFSLAIEQNLNALLHRGFGFHAQNVVAIIGNRMRNHRKAILWKARDLRHHLRGLRKTVSDNRSRSNTNFFGRECIVQTARGTAPSITNR